MEETWSDASFAAMIESSTSVTNQLRQAWEKSRRNRQAGELCHHSQDVFNCNPIKLSVNQLNKKRDDLEEKLKLSYKELKEAEKSVKASRYVFYKEKPEAAQKKRYALSDDQVALIDIDIKGLEENWREAEKKLKNTKLKIIFETDHLANLRNWIQMKKDNEKEETKDEALGTRKRCREISPERKSKPTRTTRQFCTKETYFAKIVCIYCGNNHYSDNCYIHQTNPHRLF